MIHDVHGDTEAVLHDGCAECEYRGKNPHIAIDRMDPTTFTRAWERAGRWHLTGLPDAQIAEVPLFRVLIAIQLKLERRGFPIGRLPQGTGRP